MASTRNLISECTSLATELERIYELGSGTLPKNAQAKFQLARDFLAQTNAALLDISDNVRDLTAIEVHSKAMLLASETWACLPDGRVTGEPLKQLFKQSSQALKFLHQGRVDATEAYKFSEEELSFAKELGQDFLGYEPIWSDWRFNISARDRDERHYLWINERGERMEHPDGKHYVIPNLFLKKFAKLLERRGVYAGASIAEPQICRVQGRRKVTDNEAWMPIKNGWEGFEKEYYLSTTQARVLLGEPVNKAMFQFVLGGWFEAYVQYLFSDMLERLEKPHEIVTKLKYNAVLEGQGAFNGELDVLISTEDKLVVVECKSGKLTADDAKRVLVRKKVIEQALSSVQATSMKIDFLLIHAPRSDSPDARKIVEDGGVQVMDPVEVLSFAKNHFLN